MVFGRYFPSSFCSCGIREDFCEVQIQVSRIGCYYSKAKGIICRARNRARRTVPGLLIPCILLGGMKQKLNFDVCLSLPYSLVASASIWISDPCWARHVFFDELHPTKDMVVLICEISFLDFSLFVLS